MANATEVIDYSAVTPDIQRLAEKAYQSTLIDTELYQKWDVKRGLRDLNGKGVLAGLTHISDIQAVKVVDGKSIPVDGNLYYRGYSIKDLVKGFNDRGESGFEETVYLLLFDKLPNKEELTEFQEILCRYRALPKNFVRDVIMKAPAQT